MRRPARRPMVLRALTTFGAVVLSFGVVFAICGALGAPSDAAILAAVIALSVAQRPSSPRGAAALIGPLVTPFVALAAAGVGELLRIDFVAGAIVFTGAIALSIWLRSFDARIRYAGGLLVLPFVALLVVPFHPAARTSPVANALLVAAAGLIAYAIATTLTLLAQRAGWIAPTPRTSGADGAQRRPGGGLSVPTRMALQMAVALAAAFVLGDLLFAGRWHWVVLTAFIVLSGARGRGDAAYKGILRLSGAIAGTIAAAALLAVAPPAGWLEAVTIFAVLFLGLLLREVSYACWACAMTLILAVLGHGDATLDLQLLGVRLAAILTGALCAVAAAWSVFPIRTRAVIRRRLADALLALDHLVAGTSEAAEPPDHLAVFARRLAELDEVAAPVRLHRRVLRGAVDDEHPARWIESLHHIGKNAPVLATRDCRATERAALRRAIGAARKAIAAHGAPLSATATPTPTIGSALETLHGVIAGLATSEPAPPRTTQNSRA